MSMRYVLWYMYWIWPTCKIHKLFTLTVGALGRHLHALSFTSLIMGRDGCPGTSRSFVSKFSSVERTPPGICTLKGMTRLWTVRALLRNVVSVVYFALLGSAVEILKEWNVTGKKKVRVRRFCQRRCGVGWCLKWGRTNTTCFVFFYRVRGLVFQYAPIPTTS